MSVTTKPTATTPMMTKRSTGSRPQRATMALSRFLKHGLSIMVLSNHVRDGQAKIGLRREARKESAVLGAGQDDRGRGNPGERLGTATLDRQAAPEFADDPREDI